MGFVINGTMKAEYSRSDLKNKKCIKYSKKQLSDRIRFFCSKLSIN